MYTRNQNIYEKIINFEKNDYEIIVLGLSHSSNGISKKYLKYKPLKLSTPTQDLFYNLKKSEKYSDVIKQCKSVIIDIYTYTYTYFNYDVSMSKHATDYIPENGFEHLSHNFNKNRNYNIDLKGEIHKGLNLFNNLFNINDINVLQDYIETGAIDKDTLEFIYKDHLSLKDEQDICTSFGLSSIQKNIYTHTEKENILIFNRILNILREKNKDIKIYLILIPQYLEVEKKLKILEKDWKIRFYNILNPLKQKYKFEILDFKNCEIISSNKEYYCDGGHLNCYGAKEFTQLLNSYLE